MSYMTGLTKIDTLLSNSYGENYMDATIITHLRQFSESDTQQSSKRFKLQSIRGFQKLYKKDIALVVGMGAYY